ncbi:MAG: alpha/beta fold hydrolase [Nitriliruptorales bacterium]|nr:alpha/beta fold hydrolase [Nitriliruptorales bacterium]
MSTTTRDGRAEGQRARERLLAATPLTERRDTLAGVSTAILEGGDGPPMVLLHGQGEFWGVWMQVIDDLASSHRVIVVDLPGHGTSTVVDGRLDADTLLRWVAELIDATCAAQPVLVGHLLGGAIAARYAVRHANRLSHLVLVDTMGLAWFRPSPNFAIPMMRFIARPTERSRDRLFRQCFLDFDGVGDRFGDHWDDLRTYALDRARTPENQAAMRALMPRVGVPPISRTDLDRIDVPTTLIHGRHDLQVPLRAAERAAERYGWPLHVIEDARADPAAEQPDAFVAALRSALADVHTHSDQKETS